MAINAVTEEQYAKLFEFCSIVNTNEELAFSILSNNNWDLQSAIAQFFGEETTNSSDQQFVNNLFNYSSDNNSALTISNVQPFENQTLKPIVLIGSVCVNLIALTKSFPQPGETIQGSHKLEVGNCGRIALEFSARKIKVRLVSYWANDSFGFFLRQQFTTQSRVLLEFVKQNASTTPLSIILNHQQNNNNNDNDQNSINTNIILSNIDPNQYTSRDIDHRCIENCSLILSDGNLIAASNVCGRLASKQKPSVPHLLFLTNITNQLIDLLVDINFLVANSQQLCNLFEILLQQRQTNDSKFINDPIYAANFILSFFVKIQFILIILEQNQILIVTRKQIDSIIKQSSNNDNNNIIIIHSLEQLINIKSKNQSNSFNSFDNNFDKLNCSFVPLFNNDQNQNQNQNSLSIDSQCVLTLYDLTKQFKKQNNFNFCFLVGLAQFISREFQLNKLSFNDNYALNQSQLDQMISEAIIITTFK
eukprot:TRINITY_DN0_c3_g1_i1.p1 TRINITY_DN0_c3_g1~~TRINITY_DN0_c3_g1_i1.p1  ORF type:complete len:493 (-),score=219.69 TRINITY_DN0_c3_g1_i1:91-1521(-)